MWRLLLAGVLVAALGWCCAVGIPRPWTRRAWPVVFLLILPLVAGCLNNGQASCLVIAALLAGVAATATDHWNLSAAFMASAALVKLYPVSAGMLMVVMFPRRFGWRFALALAIGALLPFALRPWAYVVDEHRRLLTYLAADERQARPMTVWYQDLRVLCAAWGVPLAAGVYLAIRLAAAAGIAAVCAAGQLSRRPRRLLLGHMVGLATCWMTVLGSATEASTYILVAPALVWSLLENFATRAGGGRGVIVGRVALAAAYGLILISYALFWFPFGRRATTYGALPLAGLLLLAYLAARSLPRPRAAAGMRPATTDPQLPYARRRGPRRAYA